MAKKTAKVMDWLEEVTELDNTDWGKFTGAAYIDTELGRFRTQAVVTEDDSVKRAIEIEVARLCGKR